MKQKQNKKAPVNIVKQNKKVTPFFWIVRNMAFLVLTIFLVLFLFGKLPTYNWVYNSLLKANYEFIKKNPDASYQDKMSMKVGVNFGYLNSLKENTPENAVILFPGRKALEKEGSGFTADILNVVYVSRELYPRKIVLADNLENSLYKDSLTHFAVISGWGLDLVGYTGKPIELGIIPLSISK